MKKHVLHFLRANYLIVIGMLAGCLVGYLYWSRVGMQWGTYPLSSECWVNCVYGSLAGGLIVALLSRK